MKNLHTCLLIATIAVLMGLMFGCKADKPERMELHPPEINSQQVKNFIPKNYDFDTTNYDAVYLFYDEKGTSNKVTCTGTGRRFKEENKKITGYSCYLRDTLNDIELWYEIDFDFEYSMSGHCDALVTTFTLATRLDRTQHFVGGASVCISDEKIKASSDTGHFPERKILNKTFKDIYCKKGQMTQADSDSTKINYETCIEAGKGIVAYAVDGRFFVCE